MKAFWCSEQRGCHSLHIPYLWGWKQTAKSAECERTNVVVTGRMALVACPRSPSLHACRQDAFSLISSYNCDVHSLWGLSRRQVANLGSGVRCARRSSSIKLAATILIRSFLQKLIGSEAPEPELKWAPGRQPRHFLWCSRAGPSLGAESGMGKQVQHDNAPWIPWLVRLSIIPAGTRESAWSMWSNENEDL